jgi:DNA-binding protein Fis
MEAHSNNYLRHPYGITEEVLILYEDGSICFTTIDMHRQELLKYLMRQFQTEDRHAGEKVERHFSWTDVAAGMVYNIISTPYVSCGQKYWIYRITEAVPYSAKIRDGIWVQKYCEVEREAKSSFWTRSGLNMSSRNQVSLLYDQVLPVLIAGAAGTSLSDAARDVYLHTQNAGFLVKIQCSEIDDKSWRFLMCNDNSPLNSNGNTILFQDYQTLTEQQKQDVICSIRDSNLSRRNRLIFTYELMPEQGILASDRAALYQMMCEPVFLPELKDQKDEIMEYVLEWISFLLGSREQACDMISPEICRMLVQYSWPDNYRQLERILAEIVNIGRQGQVLASDVQRLLEQEDIMRYYYAPVEEDDGISVSHLTLDDINQRIIRTVYADNKQNMAATARQLGISRTTLWRYLGKRSDQKNVNQG